MKRTDRIREPLEEGLIVLYMKGTPRELRCGFSAKAAAPLIMQAPPEVSDFPTFPQLSINGEVVGGTDIIEAILASGALLPMLIGAAV